MRSRRGERRPRPARAATTRPAVRRRGGSASSPTRRCAGSSAPPGRASPDDRPPCSLARPAWRRYAAVVRVDHATGEVAVVGDDERSVDAPGRAVSGRWRRRQPRFRAPPSCPPTSPSEAHLERVRAALRLIAAGDLYEVNLARRIPMAVPAAMCSRSSRRSSTRRPPPGASFRTWATTSCARASPELALSVRGDVAPHLPDQGHAPARRATPRGRRAWPARSTADPKERAELTMAVDVHRNDLGRVAVPGSVQRARASRACSPGGPCGAAWPRSSRRRAPGATLDGRSRGRSCPAGASRAPPRCAPWRSSRASSRGGAGLYTGAFGYVGRDGRLELAMAIRTLQWSRARRRQGAYFTGGGIVADSVPERELEETRWKAAQLGAAAARGMPRAAGVRDVRAGHEPRRSGPRRRCVSALASIGPAATHARRGAAWTRSSAPSAPSTGTWRPTSRWRSRRRPASRRARSPRRSSRRSPASDVVASAEVAGPGFVNLRLRPARSHAELGATSCAAGRAWGRAPAGDGRAHRPRVRERQPHGPRHRRQRPQRHPRRLDRAPARGDRAAASRASTTSTTAATRCACSPRACAPRPRAASLRRTATRARTSPSSRRG